MQFPDYTKLSYFESDYAICPNCGKLLRTKYHDNAPCLLDCDEYHGSWDHWYTCKCKDCGVSGDGSNGAAFSLDNQAAWKFPKDYEITATQKQNNYIRFLANEVGVYFNYIANKELAGEVIHQLLSLYTKKQQKVIDLDRRAKLIRTFGYTSNGEDAFIKTFGDITLELSYKQDTGFTYRVWQRDFKPGQETEDLLLAISTVKADIQKITEALFKVNRATEEDATKKIEADKEAFKKRCERDDIDEYDYGYDEAPDFGELC